MDDYTTALRNRLAKTEMTNERNLSSRPEVIRFNDRRASWNYPKRS
jgi:hypothetical protein